MAWFPAGPLSELPDRQPVGLAIGGHRLVVVRIGERVFAAEDRCSHRGFPLHDGSVDAATIRCRTHGACFDLATGAVARGPARRPLQTYAVTIADGQVLIEL